MTSMATLVSPWFCQHSKKSIKVHAYFKDHSSNEGDNQTFSDKLQNDDTCLDIINAMKFDIGVQSFSHINRIVNFHVDMKLPDTKQM